jgi:superfamily II RNA helicase
MTEENNFVTIFNKDVHTPGEIPEEDKAMEFPYELDSFQKEGIYRIYQKENVFITAHTGSGKTVLALYAIAECFRLNKKVIYTSPTKSLSNQKYAEFVEKFGGKEKIGILTGDIKMNPDAPCLIMTTEILRNILYRHFQNQNHSSYLSSNLVSLQVEDIGAVIFDEVHYINDPERGKVWEEVFVLLPSNIVLVLLSATIDKPELFAGWLGNLKQKQIHLIPTSHRVVPLRHYFWKPDRDEMIEVLMEDGIFKNYDRIRERYQKHEVHRVIPKLIEKLKRENMLPVLIFTLSRKKCEDYCRTIRGIHLLNHEEESNVRHIFHYYMSRYKEIYENLPQYQEVYEFMRRGIGYHHSGLLPILKEIVEIVFGRGYIKVLFATETFAVGVNMPTKTVIFPDIEKFDHHGKRYLRTDEYLQMSGRAGRRGLDKVGIVIQIPTMDLMEQNTLRSMMTGKSPRIQSKFRPTYQFIIKSFLTNGNMNIDDLLQKTLKNNENEKYKRRIQNEIEELEIRNHSFVLCEIEKDMKRYFDICGRLNDTFIIVKGKDRKKLEEEKRRFEKDSLFMNQMEQMKQKKEIENELREKRLEYESLENHLQQMILKMIDILKEKEFIYEPDTSNLIEDIHHHHSVQCNPKGITSMYINEVDEILMSECIHSGYLEDCSMEEIVTIFSMFIDEKDKESGDKYIDDIEPIPYMVKDMYKYMMRKANEYEQIEDRYELGLHIDNYYQNCIKTYMILPVWIWINGGDMRELFSSTNMYVGNFVKGILRLEQICSTYKDLCIGMDKHEMALKMENVRSLLIRDFTEVNSLYVN